MKQIVPMPANVQENIAFISSCEKVILFGAGLFIFPAIHALKQRGVTPVCICDNSETKHGTKINDIQVYSPLRARELFPDACVIITAAAKHIDDIRLQLNSLGYSNIFDCAPFLASFEYSQNTFDFGVSKLNYDLNRYFYEYFLKYFPEKLIIPSLDIVITEKCSLRCRDCANLMQYYETPEDIEFEELFHHLDILMECVDHVLELRVLGGEAIMNKNMHRYVNRLREYENYTRIAVYFNGTITPRDENLRCLIYDDTFSRISDYGNISKKIPEIVKIFNSHDIIYSVIKCDKWQDCATIFKRNRTQAELENVFSECCANKTLTFLRNKVYVCPFAANADNLTAIPSFPQDTLTIEGRLDEERIRSILFDIMRNKKFFSACEYCAGRPEELTPLPAAIQTSETLSYKKF